MKTKNKLALMILMSTILLTSCGWNTEEPSNLPEESAPKGLEKTFEDKENFEEISNKEAKERLELIKKQNEEKEVKLKEMEERLVKLEEEKKLDDEIDELLAEDFGLDDDVEKMHEEFEKMDKELWLIDEETDKEQENIQEEKIIDNQDTQSSEEDPDYELIRLNWYWEIEIPSPAYVFKEKVPFWDVKKIKIAWKNWDKADSYFLKKFKAWDKEFVTNIRHNLGNILPWENHYEVSFYDDRWVIAEKWIFTIISNYEERDLWKYSIFIAPNIFSNKGYCYWREETTWDNVYLNQHPYKTYEKEKPKPLNQFLIKKNGKYEVTDKQLIYNEKEKYLLEVKNIKKISEKDKKDDTLFYTADLYYYNWDLFIKNIAYVQWWPYGEARPACIEYKKGNKTLMSSFWFNHDVWWKIIYNFQELWSWKINVSYTDDFWKNFIIKKWKEKINISVLKWEEKDPFSQWGNAFLKFEWLKLDYYNLDNSWKFVFNKTEKIEMKDSVWLSVWRGGMSLWDSINYENNKLTLTAYGYSSIKEDLFKKSYPEYDKEIKYIFDLNNFWEYKIEE